MGGYWLWVNQIADMKSKDAVKKDKKSKSADVSALMKASVAETYAVWWIPDENASYCDLCCSRFTQVKRRHHCRVCGAVRCAKCCNEKIPLPQLGIEEAERVCESCKTVTELVTKSRSSLGSYLLESAKGLSSFARHEKYIKKLIELGGIQTLIVLASIDNDEVLGHVISGLHSLATHPSLHKHLADSGAIKAICRVLGSLGDKHEQITIDGISSLMIFCKSANFKIKALNDGALDVIIDLCWSNSEAILLLSISTLGLIAEQPESHSAIFDSRQNAVSRLLELVASLDEQIQEVSLKTLAFLSTGSPEYRHKLIQDDISHGQRFRSIMESNPNNPQVLCNVGCLIANLATSSQDQPGLQEILYSVCRKLPQSELNVELLSHLTRALANFAQYKQNISILTYTVPDIVRCCLKTSFPSVQLQAMRLLLTLLGQAPSRMTTLLMNEGAQAFLTGLGELPSFLSSVMSSLITDAPSTAKPL